MTITNTATRLQLIFIAQAAVLITLGLYLARAFSTVADQHTALLLHAINTPGAGAACLYVLMQLAVPLIKAGAFAAAALWWLSRQRSLLKTTPSALPGPSAE
ncbi:MAG TPA: hypothetical protein VKY85_01165 [Candidatus Angelobacter sp.]|nr:hypothetical protein [Candidatus Angelobacter sp.]